jgi:hypothetical protein
MSLFGGNNSTNEEDVWSSSEDENEMNVKNTDNIVYKLDPKFVKYITKVKKKLYHEIILKVPNNSKNAQQMGLLENYKKSLKQVYDMIYDIQKGKYKPENLKQFPTKVQPVVYKLVDFFKNKSHADTIPYDFYAHCCLVVHANIQKKELPCPTNDV